MLTAADIEDPAINQSIDGNIELARATGVTGMPTFIIGDRHSGRCQAAAANGERRERLRRAGDPQSCHVARG
jgi:hypothetical protein